MMKSLDEIREMLCVELDEIAGKGELTAGSLETVHTITDTIKNIDKICMLEEQGNSGDDMYDRGSYGGSYRGRSMATGRSYRGSGMMSSRGRNSMSYSRADSNEMIRAKMEDMMNHVSSDERMILQTAMRILGN